MATNKTDRIFFGFTNFVDVWFHRLSFVLDRKIQRQFTGTKFRGASGGKTEARRLRAHCGLWKEKIRSENCNSAHKPAPKRAWEKIGFLASRDSLLFPADSGERRSEWELKADFAPNFFAWELPALAQNWSLISWRNNWAFRNNRRTSFFQTNAANTLFQLMPMPAWLQKASMLAEESQWLKTIVSRESINTEHLVRQICFITLFLQ
jgi:hypothetical protein